jgi:hypothetical protein
MNDIGIHMNPKGLDQERMVKQLHFYRETMIKKHLQGAHPYGSRIRDCPLCVQIDKVLGECDDRR